MTEVTTSAVSSTRDRIIVAATGAFRRKGVAGAGIGEICGRAGVTKGVFSHHFPAGKDQLVREVVERNQAEVGAVLVQLAQRTTGTPGEVVAGLFRAYAGLLGERGSDFGCPVAATVVDVSSGSRSVREAADHAFRSWAAGLEPALRAAPPGSAELVVGALEGGILLARARDDPALLTRIGNRLGELLDAAAGS